MSPPVRSLSVSVIAVFVISSCAVGAAGFLIRAALKQAVSDSCGLVEEHFYDQEASKRWAPSCYRAAEHLPWIFRPEQAVYYINNILGGLPTSHLNLFMPVENQELWGTSAFETGIRARQIHEHTVIVGILPDSPNKGLQIGDEILTVNGLEVQSPYDVQKEAGFYLLKRAGKEFSYHVQALEIAQDDAPQLHRLDGQNAILRIGNFLPQYFEDKEKLLSLTYQMNQYSHLIVDLRDNNGGSFPAMLRALSPFFCQPTWIGSLHRGGQRDDKGVIETMSDNLDVDNQLKELDESTQLKLNTFPDYGCFRGHVTVLVDAGTSSTAEIFAEAFLHSLRFRVWGLPTAGQVVMAEWFPVPVLGSYDFSLSIPIAGYQTKGGEAIEGAGVSPQQYLRYDLTIALRGEDSWIQSSLYKSNQPWRISF
jgi:C-terminal processing protease CtpA/Prc